MTINITDDIKKAYDAFLNEPVDCYIDGKAILRKETYPYFQGFGGLVDFAAGWLACEAHQEFK